MSTLVKTRNHPSWFGLYCDSYKRLERHRGGNSRAWYEFNARKMADVRLSELRGALGDDFRPVDLNAPEVREAFFPSPLRSFWRGFRRGFLLGAAIAAVLLALWLGLHWWGLLIIGTAFGTIAGGCAGATPKTDCLIELLRCPIDGGHLFAAKHVFYGSVEICESGRHVWRPSVADAELLLNRDGKTAAAGDGE